MNEIEKLLRKISKQDRLMLLEILDELQNSSKSLRIEKLAGSDFYKIKRGRYRIIIHYAGKDAIVDSIKLRNEKTYKGL